MGEQSYVLHCKIEVASGAIAREFELGRYERQYRVVAAREREDSRRVIWRLRHTDPDFTLGSLECVSGRGDTTRLIVEDPPITIWKPTALEEVDGDFDRLAEETESKIKGAKARDTAHRSIQVMLVEDLLHTLEAEYDIPVSSPAAEAARRALADWGAGKVVSLPWQSPFPFSLEDVEAACHEHLERLAGKRFPADWDVQVTRYVEREGIALRYDVQSAGRMAGHLRVRRIDAQQTQLEVTANPNGNEADEARLREIMAAFAGRWLAELPASSDPSTRAGQDDLTLVNLYSTAGTMSPGLYPAKPGQAKAIELANAAISNLKYQFGKEAAGVTEERNEKGSNVVGMVDELLRPMNVNWPMSKLKRWFVDFSDDNGLHLVVFHSPAKGYIDIYKDPFTYVGIKCEPQADGQILLTPYITDKATSEAIGELQQWRDALVVAIEDDTLVPITSTTSGDMDEDEKHALLAKRYGPKLGRNLRTTTIQTWLNIAEHKRRVVSGEVVLLTDAQVVERTGINQDTYDTHKKDMKKSGFWRDYGLDPE